MTRQAKPLDPALVRTGERICEAAGTDLDAVLTELTGDTGGSHAPAAIRAGWAVLDTSLPTRDEGALG